MKINEIFKSIQGETSFQGIPSVFVRTSGCNLRCKWCDTQYAYSEGIDYTIDELIRIIENFDCRYVVITGGEPLLQNETPLLAEKLIQGGYRVLLETSGSLDISGLHPQIIRIVDIKCPSSGMTEKMLWDNMESLSYQDEVKFVISNYEDYLWSKSILRSYMLIERCSILMSPVFNKLDPKALAEWIITDKLPVRMQLQIHKYIWGPDCRGV